MNQNIDDLYKKLLILIKKNFEWLKKADNAKVYINKYFYPEKITRELRRYLLDKLLKTLNIRILKLVIVIYIIEKKIILETLY